MNFEEFMAEEGSLHAWFNKSKSKDGKPGWVQSDGSTCARKPGQKSAPKCYSSQRLAGLKKTAEGRKKIRSADARKKSQDSGQASKSGAAKPTYVRTFKDNKDLKKHPSGDSYKDRSEGYGMTFDKFMNEANANALTTGASKNNTETLQSKQAAFNKNMKNDPLVKGLQTVYNVATNLNPKGMVKGTFNQGAADGSLDAAKAKGLVK